MKKWSILLVLLVIGVIFSSCANQFSETMTRGLEGTKTYEKKDWDGDKSDYTYTQEEFESKAESMGITVEELKVLMLEEFESKLESKAESMGITVEELIELMSEGKKEK
ncbi:MAG TPA: hypothetical protein P5107_09970 [Thermotogota bacterium]|nr:hypothetical protein [Thermotogota bacterium]